MDTLSQEVAELSTNSQTVNGTLSELRREVANATTLADVLQVINWGLTQTIPAESCREISKNRPDLSSNNYWIRSSNGTVVQLYCDMARQCCNETTGGWTRVAFLNMTDPNQHCPPAWREITSPVRVCGRFANFGSCESVFYPTNGVSYSQVCGRVIAYQLCGTDAFLTYILNSNRTLDSFYVDGVSIRHGSNPRHHVWTFASAHSERLNTTNICPCTNVNYANIDEIIIPPFIGDDYFCDSGFYSLTSCTASTFSTDELWDGEGCSPTSTCCEFNNPPWFCKTLHQPTADDIEVRICDDKSSALEDVHIGLLEIYAQ